MKNVFSLLGTFFIAVVSPVTLVVEVLRIYRVIGSRGAAHLTPLDHVLFFISLIGALTFLWVARPQKEGR
jgi:hypothetical protein